MRGGGGGGGREREKGKGYWDRTEGGGGRERGERCWDRKEDGGGKERERVGRDIGIEQRMVVRERGGDIGIMQWNMAGEKEK